MFRGLAILLFAAAGVTGVHASDLIGASAARPHSPNTTPCLQGDHGGDRLAVLVHGVHGSPARMAELADALSRDGFTALCFTYNDRADLDESAAALAHVLARLQSLHPILVVGHSLGGLVTRRALSATVFRAGHGTRYDLVTVSTPLSGIAAAAPCLDQSLSKRTLGLSRVFCRLGVGAKWDQIGPQSPFITAPDALANAVVQHLAVLTDEAGSCRSLRRDGDCRKSDFVFSLDEQMPSGERDRRFRTTIIKAGHTAVLGRPDMPPTAIIGVLRSLTYRTEHLTTATESPAGGTADGSKRSANVM